MQRNKSKNFLIGNTKSQSRLTLKGKILNNVKSCTDAAAKIGRAFHYGDEKRRLLSIVAKDLLLHPSAIIWLLPKQSPFPEFIVFRVDVGEFLPPEFIFTRQRVGPQIMEEVTKFLHV